MIAHTAEFGVRGRATPSSVAGGSASAGLSWNVSAFRTLLHDDIYGIATSVSQGFFQNIGDTRRQGIEAGLTVGTGAWSANANYSLVQATFRSPLRVPSPSSPFQDALGDIQVEPGDHLPGIPSSG